MVNRVFDVQKSQSTLFAELLAVARRQGHRKVAIEDAEGQILNFGRLVLGSRILGSKIAAFTEFGERVGVLLPNAAGLAVTLFGLNAYGRVAGMLNFTAGPRNLEAAVKTGPLPIVLTSRRFIRLANLESLVAALEKVEVRPGVRVDIRYLEDVRESITLADKLAAMVTASRAAARHRKLGIKPNDIAVILFTSGTEGAPKGVALTNANLLANANQIFAHAAGMLTPDDIVLNPLPMFHSFGLTAATLMPLLNGLKVVL
nr:AMP-binding protein [Alphaproteobacteria bacterium]